MVNNDDDDDNNSGCMVERKKSRSLTYPLVYDNLQRL